MDISMTRKNAEEIREELLRINKRNAVVIVEGMKDEAALQHLGILRPIRTLRGNPLYAVAEAVAEETKEAIILTDLDREGKKLYGKLSTELQRLGVNINNNARNFLFKETEVRQIEGLKSLLLHLQSP